MKLLVAAATEAEIAELLRICDRHFNPDIPGLSRCTLYEGQKTFYVLITGVGAPATIFSLSNVLRQIQVDLVIQAGICGSFTGDLGQGTAVVLTKDRFAGIGAEDDSEFLDVFEMGLADPNNPPYQDGWIKVPDPADIRNIADLPRVSGITVETVTGSENTAAVRRKKYHPDVESMEGAAVFYVCALTKTPCFQLRTVSNFVERRNKLNWNIPLAVEVLHHTLIETINEIC